jgi:hypothetical protein
VFPLYAAKSTLAVHIVQCHGGQVGRNDQCWFCPCALYALALLLWPARLSINELSNPSNLHHISSPHRRPPFCSTQRQPIPPSVSRRICIRTHKFLLASFCVHRPQAPGTICRPRQLGYQACQLLPHLRILEVCTSFPAGCHSRRKEVPSTRSINLLFVGRVTAAQSI